MNRRSFIRNTALVGTTAAAGVPQPAPAAEPTPRPAPPDATGTLARFIVSARFEDLPEAARTEAARSLLNWMGVAVGGSHHETIDIALAAVTPFAGPPQAGLFGRKERLDIMNAALLNGISSHVFDFDDTDLLTAVHPSAPVVPALLAMAEYRKVSGHDFVNAMVLGIEAECRIARAVTPAMQDVGWHATGAAGVFGAAVATAKILGLDQTRMCHAIGLAATQPVGLREMFGSMTKSFHPGRAAQNGMLAALLAEKGYTSSLHGIEAKRGWANVLSTEQHYDAITGDLGKTYEIFRNSYKPFACGLVVHAVIDGCIQLRNENKLTPDMIDRIDLAVHPIVLELTSKRNPRTGLEGKFSVYYAAAIAVIAGQAGEAQFSDAAVTDPVAVALRDRVETTIGKSLAQDQARVTIKLKDGRVLNRFITHAVGSVQVPMTNQQLEAKFTNLVAGILPDDRARHLIDLCWNVERSDDAGDIARAAAAA
ncbi:MmgE/PrpD family protein [Acidisphaera sp. S103]|uniref:MmgE/PrpD family protein n=1 Tax=Acidisphaera sp. S103 TaxID=1747223 RepID=UPI00131AC40F|nr:MmgE/PrpD family protein [Acidisphaera sp. S103]